MSTGDPYRPEPVVKSPAPWAALRRRRSRAIIVPPAWVLGSALVFGMLESVGLEEASGLALLLGAIGFAVIVVVLVFAPIECPGCGKAYDGDPGQRHAGGLFAGQCGSCGIAFGAPVEDRIAERSSSQ